MDNTIVSIFGRKGSGKTTLVKAMLEEHRRVLIIDTLGEYEPFVEGLKPSVEEIMALREKRRFKRAFRVLGSDAMDRNANLALLDLIYASHENVLVVVEEASLVCSPQSLPDEVAALIRYGRHRQIDQFYVARRPSEVHRDVTAQSDLIITFQQNEPRDLLYLTAYMGKKGALAARLPKYAVLAHGDMTKAPPVVLAQRYSPKPVKEKRLEPVEEIA